jgi:hypothetical protein
MWQLDRLDSTCFEPNARKYVPGTQGNASLYTAGDEQTLLFAFLAREGMIP